MKQYSFDFTHNRMAYLQQEADKAMIRAAEKEKEVEELREKLRRFNALSRERKSNSR